MQKILSKRILRDLKENSMRYLALSALIILCMYVIISLIGTADTIMIGTEKLAESNHLEEGEFSLFVPLSDKEKKELTDQGITLEEQFYLDYVMEDGRTLRAFGIRQIIREARTSLTVVGGMFISLLILMLGLNCYVMCQHISKDNKADAKFEYLYTYKYPEERAPEGGYEAFTKTVKKENMGYNLMKVMIDRCAFHISMVKVFGYRTKEIKKLYLDGNFYVIAVGAAVCIPLAPKCMDLIYPIMVSNVNCGMKIVVFVPTFVQLTDRKTGIRMKRLKLTGFKTYHKEKLICQEINFRGWYLHSSQY